MVSAVVDKELRDWVKTGSCDTSSYKDRIFQWPSAVSGRSNQASIVTDR